MNNEIEEILDEFILFRDDTPHSNEPTELSVFLKQCGYPDAMERLRDELVAALKHREQALLDRVEKEVIGEDDYPAPGYRMLTLSKKHRNELRGEQRQSLTTLRKEYEG